MVAILLIQLDLTHFSYYSRAAFGYLEFPFALSGALNRVKREVGASMTIPTLPPQR